MAGFTLLDSLPAPVRVFIRRAQAAGIEYSETSYADDEGTMVSLHGDVSAFLSLPEMAGHRIPLKEGKWWLKLGIVGRLYRQGDRLDAVIDWTRDIGPRTRFQLAQHAAVDHAFGTFMARVLQSVDAA